MRGRILEMRPTQNSLRSIHSVTDYRRGQLPVLRGIITCCPCLMNPTDSWSSMCCFVDASAGTLKTKTPSPGLLTRARIIGVSPLHFCAPSQHACLELGKTASWRTEWQHVKLALSLHSTCFQHMQPWNSLLEHSNAIISIYEAGSYCVGLRQHSPGRLSTGNLVQYWLGISLLVMERSSA